MGQSVPSDGRMQFEMVSDGLRCHQPVERESGSDPRIWSGGDGRLARPVRQRKRARRNQRENRKEISFLCEGQGALEWVRPERGANALESVAPPAASGELPLARENPGEMV